jgi:hypothetical protein
MKFVQQRFSPGRSQTSQTFRRSVATWVLAEAKRKFLPVAAESAAAITLLGLRACFVGSGVLRAGRRIVASSGTQRQKSDRAELTGLRHSR